MKMPKDRAESIKNTIGMFFHIFGVVGFLLLAATAYSVFMSEDGLSSPLLDQKNWYAFGMSAVSVVGLIVYRIKFGGIDWYAGLTFGLPKWRKK